MMNRWDKRRQIEREREPGNEVARIVALRNVMATDLRYLQGRLEGIETAIRIMDDSAPEESK